MNLILSKKILDNESKMFTLSSQFHSVSGEEILLQNEKNDESP